MRTIVSIEMTLTLDNGATVRVSMDNESIRRWGAETPEIGATVDVTEAMQEAAREAGAFVCEYERRDTEGDDNGDTAF